MIVTTLLRIALGRCTYCWGRATEFTEYDAEGPVPHCHAHAADAEAELLSAWLEGRG